MCRFSDDGCDVEMVAAKIARHEAVCEYRHPDNRKSFTRLVDSLRYDERSFVSFRQGPVRKPEVVNHPDDFEALIDRRLGSFFDRPEAS